MAGSVFVLKEIRDLLEILSAGREIIDQDYFNTGLSSGDGGFDPSRTGANYNQFDFVIHGFTCAAVSIVIWSAAKVWQARVLATPFTVTRHS